MPKTASEEFFLGYDNPHFWYIRENLVDLPYPKEENFYDFHEYRQAIYAFHQTIQREITIAAENITQKTNLEVIDNSPRNWGVRTEPHEVPTIVLRDLACGDDLMWWEGIDQQTQL